jgi:hypothetical protein
MKQHLNLSVNCLRLIIAFEVMCGFMPGANGMIKESLIVHNSRTETITVSVYNSRSKYEGTFYVDAKGNHSFRLGDKEEGSDYFEAYDLRGKLLKTGIASGIYSNFDWWVD